MQDYYDELWQRLPEGLLPQDFERRVAFLLAHVAPGERVLDIGCGEGQFSARLHDAGAEPTGVEVAGAAVARAQRLHPDLRFVHVALGAPLPFADGEFNAVWAGEVIEHVADTAPWLAELRRVLRPGGRLLLSTPDHGRLRLLLDGIERHSEPLGEHLHLYTARSLRTLLGEFGFIEVAITRAGGIPLLRRTLLALAVR